MNHHPEPPAILLPQPPPIHVLMGTGSLQLQSYPLAPPGMKVMINVKPDVPGLWEPYAI